MSRRARTAARLWRAQQERDPFVQRARREGFRARSVYKLEEIDRRLRLLRPGLFVLDLGAAPGSWSQYAVRRGCRVVAVDRIPMDPIEGVEIIQGEVGAPELADALTERWGRCFDVVLSDLAPATSGQADLDRLRSEALVEEVLALSERLLKPGGDVLVKLLKGAEAHIAQIARPRFDRIRHLRPKATRKRSSELYLLLTGLRPEAEA